MLIKSEKTTPHQDIFAYDLFIEIFACFGCSVLLLAKMSTNDRKQVVAADVTVYLHLFKGTLVSIQNYSEYRHRTTARIVLSFILWLHLSLALAILSLFFLAIHLLFMFV